MFNHWFSDLHMACWFAGKSSGYIAILDIDHVFLPLPPWLRPLARGQPLPSRRGRYMGSNCNVAKLNGRPQIREPITTYVAGYKLEWHLTFNILLLLCHAEINIHITLTSDRVKIWSTRRWSSCAARDTVRRATTSLSRQRGLSICLFFVDIN